MLTSNTNSCAHTELQMAVFLPETHTHTKGGCVNRRWDLGQEVPTEGLPGQSAALTPPLHPWAVPAPFRFSDQIFCCTNIFFSLIKRMEVSQELVVFPTFTLCLLAVGECVRLSCCCPSLTGFRGQAAAWRLGSVRFHHLLCQSVTPRHCRTLVTDWVVTEGYICSI